MKQKNSEKNPFINRPLTSTAAKKPINPEKDNQKNKEKSAEKNKEKNNEKNKDLKKSINNVMKCKKVLNKKQTVNRDNKLAKLTTFQKIIKLQEDLKIISSIKQQFEGNRRKMIEKINLGCHNYFMNKISMKKICDYCSNSEPETEYEYTLLTDKESKDLLLNYYNNLSEFFFILRNDNNLMIKLIENFEKENYENISDFLVNFCYEDTINNSLIQEELLILIYLLLEKYILTINPENIKKENNDDDYNENYYSSYIKNNILYHIFTSLTRKPDIRNYLRNILSELILSIEKIGNILTVDIGQIFSIIEEKKIDKFFRLKTLKVPKNKHYLIKLSNSLKSNKKNDLKKSAKIEHKQTIDDIMKEIGENNEINNNENKKKNDKTEEIGLGINKDINIAKVDPFLIKCDTTKEYIEKKLKEYEQFKLSDLDELNANIIKSMKEYLNSKIIEVKQSEFEKFSNFVLINSLNTPGNKIFNEEINSNILFDYFKSSYQNIIQIISEFLNILKKNINSIPYIIKSILNIIDFLLDYKYKNKLSLFKKYIFKANFFIGNIILPILDNPFYNGIITDKIISRNTLKNCKMIASILNVVISGQLFYVAGEPCKTIFNHFIIDIMPEILEIIQMIEMDFNLPEIITDLIASIKDMNNIKRNINYNYFYENEEEKFQIQSICFSYSNAINIINALKKVIKEISFNEKEDKNKKEIIEYIINYSDIYDSIFNNILSKSKKEFERYIYITKIIYLPSLENKMNSILKDNFISNIPPKKEKFKEEEISRFKRCLSKVLTYSNLIHKEDMSVFTEINSNKYIYDQKLIEILLKKTEKKRYEEIMKNKSDINNITKENIKNIILNPDFKNEILPAILVKVKEELGANINDENYQRILYCCSYIQLHIEFLPEKYSQDNYKNLCIELIKDTEDNVIVLRNNILNQLNEKIKDSSKTNLIISNACLEIKNMEKLKCLQYLYNKIELPSSFNKIYSTSKTIESVEYMENSENLALNKLEEQFFDYTISKDIDDLISFEEKIGLDKALESFFQNLKKRAKKENILKRYSLEEIQNLLSNLVDFVHSKLYHKIFPKNRSKIDEKFYKKCLRLQFIKPENVLKNKNMINENLCGECSKYINDIDKKTTPMEKIKYFGKAISILQNSINFSSGAKTLGIDDTLKPLIYVMVKAKPKNIFSNYNYCRIFLDTDLSKLQYGSLLTQMGMIINIIKEMKYNELIGVTEEQFGVDEE